MLQQISFHYVGALVSAALPFISVYSWLYTRFRLVPELPKHICYLSREVSVISDTQWLAVRKVKIFILRNYFYKLWDVRIAEGSTNFPEIYERPQNSRLQKGLWFEARSIIMNTGQNLNTKFTTTAIFLGRSMSSMTRKGLEMKIRKQP